MIRQTMSLGVFVITLYACDQSKSPAPKLEAEPGGTIEVVAVAARRLRTTHRLPAELVAFESVAIFPRVTGFIEQIQVDVGSRVQKGQVLIRLSAPELLAQRAQSQSALHVAQSQLASAQAKLVSDEGTRDRLAGAAKTPGVVAENDLMVANQTVEADRAAVDSAEANVSAARDGLRAISQMQSYLDVTAPFSGIVTRRDLHPGALVGPASAQSGAAPIVEIADIARLRLVLPVPEAEVGEMQQGLPVTFSVPAYLGETFMAPIARISHEVDSRTRTMHVELDVDNADGKLAPGSFATVMWPVERSYPTLFVPTSAVTNDQQRTFVIRVRNGAAEWVTVQTGQTVDKEIELAGELHEGDEVVRTASDAIRDGQKIHAALGRTEGHAK